MTDPPIYDDLSREHGIDVPERPSPRPRLTDPDEISPRPDGSWCEDRSVGDDITDLDGVE